MADRWLKGGAVFAVCVAVLFGVACGGGGGGGGGAVEEPPVETAFLNGSVSYVSGALGKPISKPGGKTLYRLPHAPGDDYIPIPGATIRLYAITDTTFSDPLAETTAGDDGSYTFTDGDLLGNHTMEEITNKPLVVRAVFTSVLSGTAKTIAIKSLVDMKKKAAADAAGETYTASIDPITTAVLQKVLNVFADLGLALTEEQYAALEALVSSIVGTAMAEASAAGTSFTLDESLLVADDPDLDASGVADFLESDVIDGAVSGLETEASGYADITDPTVIVNKYINWLASMGFFVGDGQGSIAVRVPPYVTDRDGVEVDVIATLVGTANSGVARPPAGVGYASDLVYVNLSKLFALDGTLPVDGDGNPIVDSLVDLALVGGDDTTWPHTYDNQALAYSIKAVWNVVGNSNAVMGRKLLEDLVINRKNERVSVEEIAIGISTLFEWWTEDKININGYVQYMGQRKLDANIDPHGPAIQVATVLGLLTGTIPATAYDYALQIASSDANLFEMAEGVLMDIVFREWKLYVATWDSNGDGIFDAGAPMFDPYVFLFSKITSFDDVKKIVRGNYDLDGDGTAELVGVGGAALSKSDIFSKKVEEIKKRLLSSLPSEWFGATIAKETLCSFKPAMLMIMKVVNARYLLDKTLGYMKEVTYADGSTGVEPLWDNFKWMQPKQEIQEAVAPSGVDPVLKAFFEDLFDGVNPAGTAYKAADGTTDLAALNVDAAMGAGIDPNSLWAVSDYGFWFMDEFHEGMDMARETGQGALAAGHITFKVVRFDGTLPQGVTQIKVYQCSDGTYLGDATMDAQGIVTTKTNFLGGLASQQDYEFEFIFDAAVRTDTVQFWVWLPDFMPDDEPDGVGDFDMTRWGDVFWMPPPGGFQDFPWFSFMPNDGWYDTGGSFLKVGVRLAGYEEGMMFVDESYTPSYDMRLESTATAGTFKLTFSAGVTASHLPATYNGLWSLLGLETSAYWTSGTDVSASGISLTPQNFDGTTGVTQYTGTLIAVTDPSGRKFVVQLDWMSWDGWLDCRFGKIDSYGKLVAPSGSGFIPPPPGGGGMAWLMGGDYYNLETGEWAPPAFNTELWAIDARARAQIQYNNLFDAIDPLTVDAAGLAAADEKKLYSANGEAQFVSVDEAAIDTDGDLIVDTAVDFPGLFAAPVTGISVFPGQLIAAKVNTTTPAYYLIRVTSVCAAESWGPGSFYAGEVGLAYAGDMDANGVPDYVPTGEGSGEIPADKAGMDTLLDWNYYNFEDYMGAKWMVLDWTDGSADLMYEDSAGPAVQAGGTIKPEMSWMSWMDVNPMYVDHMGIPLNNTELVQAGYFYSIITPEGNVLAILVKGIDVVDPPSIDVEWRFYKRQMQNVADFFADIDTRVGAVKTFSISGDSDVGTYADTETWTYQASALLKDGMTLAAGIRQAPTAGEVRKLCIDYTMPGDLVIFGVEKTGGATADEYSVFNPPLLITGPQAFPGQFLWTQATEGVYDSAGALLGTRMLDFYGEVMMPETIMIGTTPYENCLVLWVTYIWPDRYRDEKWYLSPGIGIVKVDRYADGYDAGGNYHWKWEIGEMQP